MCKNIIKAIFPPKSLTGHSGPIEARSRHCLIGEWINTVGVMQAVMIELELKLIR